MLDNRYRSPLLLVASRDSTGRSKASRQDSGGLDVLRPQVNIDCVICRATISPEFPGVEADRVYLLWEVPEALTTLIGILQRPDTVVRDDDTPFSANIAGHACMPPRVQIADDDGAVDAEGRHAGDDR